VTDGSFPPAIVAAAITGAVSLAVLAINALLTGHRERVNRRRDIFLKAFTTAVSYEEFPYVVRRRRASSPEDERIRISNELREVQEKISYYSAWLSTESPNVSQAYNTLIRQLRVIAGTEISKAWNKLPINEDNGMNMPDLGLGALRPFKDAYLREVSAELSVFPKWKRRPQSPE
jgi:hypothetical protein